MNHPIPKRPFIISPTAALVCAPLALLVFFTFRNSPEAVSTAAPAATPRMPEAMPQTPTRDAPSPVSPDKLSAEAVGLPTQVVASAASLHTHHADCAHCAMETKLSSFREEFAQMEFRQIAGDRQLSPDQSERLLQACRSFAAAVLVGLTDDSGPEQVSEAVRLSQRQMILGPILTQYALTLSN